MAKVSDAHLEARKRSILDAATCVFSQKGIEIATMAEVAAAAGISPGAIYRYFENKDQLARGCMTAKADAIEAQWEQPDETSGDPMGAFSDLSRLTFGALNDPASRVDTMLVVEQMLMTARGHAPETGDHIRAEFPAVVTGMSMRLQRGQQAGQLPPDIDPTALAGALFAFYWGARLVRMIDPETDTDALLDALFRVLQHAAPAPQVPRPA